MSLDRADYLHKGRYPDPAPPPAAWSGWRRQRRSDAAWELAVVAAATKGKCYQVLMDASELVGGGPVEWEYLIVPAGENPNAGPHASKLDRHR